MKHVIVSIYIWNNSPIKQLFMHFNIVFWIGNIIMLIKIDPFTKRMIKLLIFQCLICTVLAKSMRTGVSFTFGLPQGKNIL